MYSSELFPMLKKAAMILAVICMIPALPTHGDGGGGGATKGSSEYKQAVKAIKKEDYSGAVDLLQKVVAEEPGNAHAWNHLGFSLRNLQQYDDALAAYEKALQINPKHKGALEYLGELFLMTNQPEMAKVQLEKLDDACFLSCKELRKLKKRIAAYQGGP